MESRRDEMGRIKTDLGQGSGWDLGGTRQDQVRDPDGMQVGCRQDPGWIKWDPGTICVGSDSIKEGI